MKTGKMIITDFDGTLRRNDGIVGEIDLRTLELLGGKNIIRVIATGRSPFSFLRTVGFQLPVDYMIFSTGSGIAVYPGWNILRKTFLSSGDVRKIIDEFIKADLDFMIQQEIPDNHRFIYYRSGKNNPDFFSRIRLYEGYCQPFESVQKNTEPATQLVAIIPSKEDGLQTLEMLRKRLPEFNIIRTTSPLDEKSTWIEVFPENASKSIAAEWLTDRLNISSSKVLAIGNDFNDLDLLEWSGTSFVVANAPGELRSKYRTVSSNDNNGVAEAINLWLSENGESLTNGYLGNL